ncbi:MAG: hypothetical protein V2I43_11610 [Parvularcula sp.]|nr:hypothetical protein [Parvularcula sp.]
MTGRLKKVLMAAGLSSGLIVLAMALLVVTFFLLTPPRPLEPQLDASVIEDTTIFGGRERKWLLFEPDVPATEPWLVLVLPGSQLTAELMRALFAYGLDKRAARDGHFLLYPEGWKLEWNGCRDAPDNEAHNLPVDDVGFLTSLIAEIRAEKGIAAHDVFVIGLSGGGQMAYRLATERPKLFSAAAVLVAQQPEPSNSRCREPQGPVPMLIMNGTADPLIPYEGGIPSFYGLTPAGPVQSMEGTIRHWKGVNGLTGQPEVRRIDHGPDGTSSWAEHRAWEDGTASLHAYIIHGGGHTVPGGWQYAPAFVVGPVNRDIDAAEVIWSFFGAEALKKDRSH